LSKFVRRLFNTFGRVSVFFSINYLEDIVKRLIFVPDFKRL